MLKLASVIGRSFFLRILEAIAEAGAPWRAPGTARARPS